MAARPRRAVYVSLTGRPDLAEAWRVLAQRCGGGPQRTLEALLLALDFWHQRARGLEAEVAALQGRLARQARS